MSNAFDVIFDYVMQLEIIDTHEHLPVSENAREKNTDLLKEYLRQYFRRDLISAGLKIEDFSTVIDNALPLMERWKLVEPYWEFSRNTGYGRALDISVKELYGYDKICRSTVEQINESFLSSLKPGHFKKVLKDKAKIKMSLVVSNSTVACDMSFFRIVLCIDNLIFPKTIDDIKLIGKESGIKILSFDDWLEACERRLDNFLEGGIPVLKCGLAYIRPLKFGKVTKNEAEHEFNEMFQVLHFPEWITKAIPIKIKFQDYMMHYLLRLSSKRNLTVQFHTGLQEGNGNIISNSDPSLLANLFLEYPDIDFDIFHIGYPYQHVLSALAKMFPNVFIDMCWAHIISPTASINALIEWIDSVPVNKISAFGGDHRFVDAVFGHQYIARMNVSRALAKKIEDAVFDIATAKVIAKMLFYDNAMRIFKLH